jgi:hypothetical protein
LPGLVACQLFKRVGPLDFRLNLEPIHINHSYLKSHPPEGSSTMKPYSSRLVLVLFALSAVPAFAAPAKTDDRQVLKQLQALNTRYAQALKKKDLESAVQLLAPDFTARLLDGQVLDRQQTVARLRKQMEAVQTVREATCSILRLKVKGQEAETLLHKTFSGTVVDAAGGLHRLDEVTLLRDTWLR